LVGGDASINSVHQPRRVIFLEHPPRQKIFREGKNLLIGCYFTITPSHLQETGL